MRKWGIITVIGSGLVVGLLIFLSHRDATDTQRDSLGAEASTTTTPVALGGSGGAQPPAAADAVASPPEQSAAQATPRAWEQGAWRAGVQAFEVGDYATARAALTDAVRERDDIPYRHYLLGLTLLRVGEPASAAVELETARDHAPDNVRVLVNLARARLELADVPAARTVVQHALELDAQDADAQLVAGRVSLAEGDAEAAATCFARAAELAPEQAWAWNNLGYARIQQERFAEAVDPLRTATQLRDDVAAFFNNLGVALERTGDLAGAHFAYQRAGVLGHAVAVASGARVDALLIAQGLDPQQLPIPPAGDELAAQPADSLTTAASLGSAGQQ